MLVIPKLLRSTKQQVYFVQKIYLKIQICTEDNEFIKTAPSTRCSDFCLAFVRGLSIKCSHRHQQFDLPARIPSSTCFSTRPTQQSKKAKRLHSLLLNVQIEIASSQLYQLHVVFRLFFKIRALFIA